MRLAHFGTFDVENYGDLLFPLLVEQALSHEFDDFVHVSPVGGKPYGDVPASIGYDEFRSDRGSVDMVILGGGNILHTRTTTLPAYSEKRTRAYPELWIGAGATAVQSDAPLIVNSPGAPKSFVWPDVVPLNGLFDRAALFSVRDQASARRVAAATGQHVDISPDTALLISRALPFSGQSDLDAIGLDLVVGGYIALHVNDRYLGMGLNEVAVHLDAISKRAGLPIVLLGIGPCHGDSELVESLGAMMKSQPILVARPSKVTTIAHLIAGSAFYVGSSLHGFITAASFQVPGFLVTPGSKQHKFAGFLEHVDGQERLFEGWDSFSGDLSQGAVSRQFSEPVDTGAATAKLAEHWDRIRQISTERTRNAGPGGSLSEGAIRRISARNRVVIPLQAVRHRLSSMAKK